MAEFSKQYVESHMPEWKWDFDLYEEFDKLQPGEFTPLICEGFGFIGIQKQLDGSWFCLYRDEKDRVIEIPYAWKHKKIKGFYDADSTPVAGTPI